MKQIEINGTMLEFNIYDADTFERYEKAENRIKEAPEKAKKRQETEGFAGYIRSYCEDVKKGFDEVFGEGAGAKVCGENDDLEVCAECFASLAQAVKDQAKKLKENRLLASVLENEEES